MSDAKSDALRQAIELIKAGHLQEARPLLADFVRNNPNSDQGWYWLSFVAGDARQQADCAQRAIQLNPANSPARKRLLEIKAGQPPAKQAASTPARPAAAAPFSSQPKPVLPEPPPPPAQPPSGQTAKPQGTAQPQKEEDPFASLRASSGDFLNFTDDESREPARDSRPGLGASNPAFVQEPDLPQKPPDDTDPFAAFRTSAFSEPEERAPEAGQADLDADFLASLNPEPIALPGFEPPVEEKKSESPAVFRPPSVSFGEAAAPFETNPETLEAPAAEPPDDLLSGLREETAPLPETADDAPSAEVVYEAVPADTRARQSKKERPARKKKKAKLNPLMLLFGILSLGLCAGILVVTYVILSETFMIQTPTLLSLSTRLPGVLPTVTPTPTATSLINALPPTWTPTPQPSATLTPTWTPTIAVTITQETGGTPVSEVTEFPTRPASLVGVRQGDYAPDFSLEDAFKGKNLSLYQFSGQPVAVLFWNAACKDCMMELSALQEQYALTRDNGLVALAINVGDDPADARLAISQLGLTYNILLDPESKVKTAYKVTSYPVSLFIRRDGRISVVHKGFIGSNGFKYEIETIMK